MSRFVVAWVRMWTSSPIATPCAARRHHVERSVGRDDAAQHRSGDVAQQPQPLRSRAAVSRPNQATSPGPWFSGANARVPPSRVVDHPHRRGRADARGHRHHRAVLVGRLQPAPSPSASNRSAPSTSPAQPSATIAARIERRSGSQTSVDVDRRVRSAAAPAGRRGPGTTSRGRLHTDEHRHAACRAAGRPRRWPVDDMSAAARSSRRERRRPVGVAAGRDTPVHLHDRAPLLAQPRRRTGGSPTLTT